MNSQHGTSSDASAGHPVHADANQSDPRHVLSELLRIVYQRRWIFFVPFCLATIAAMLISHYLPRHYVAKTIFERRDDVAVANLVKRNSPHSFDTIRRSLSLDLKGPAAIAEAIADINETIGPDELPNSGKVLLATPQQRQKLLTEAVKEVKIKLLDKSNHLDLIEVSCYGTDPVLVQKLANRLRDNYVQRTRDQITSILENAKEFFQAESRRYRQRIDKLQMQAVDMQFEHPGVDPADPSSIYEQLNELQVKFDELQSKKLELQAQVRARQTFLDRFGPSVACGTPPGKDQATGSLPANQRLELQMQLHQVQSQITDLKTVRSMTDQHPAVVALRRKFTYLQDQLSALPPEDETTHAQAQQLPFSYTDEEYTSWLAQRGSVHMDLQALKEILGATQKELQITSARLDKMKKIQAGMAGRRHEYNSVQDALDAAKADMAVWQRNLEEVSRHLTAEQQDRGIKFATLEEAKPIFKPVSPKASVVFALAMALGLGVGAGCVVIAELLDRSFRTAGQVMRSLGLPVLEGIGEIVTPALRRRRLVLQTVVAPVVIITLAAGLFYAGATTYLRFERPTCYSIADHQQLDIDKDATG